MFLFLFLLIIFFFAATLWKSNYISAELLFSKSILMHRAFSWGNAYTSLKNRSACFFRYDWKMTFQWPCHTSDFWKIRPFFETPRLRIEDLSNRRSFFNVAIWVAQFTLSSRLWFEAICASGWEADLALRDYSFLNCTEDSWILAWGHVYVFLKICSSVFSGTTEL